jgi:transcriptional regulator with XRE-family HTH domain
METARTFGERVVAAYTAAGLNRSQLQQKLGVAYTTILAWERDESTPTVENLESLSVVVGVPSSVLRGEAEPMTEADYVEWGRFLETSEGRSMARGERVALGSIRFDSSDPPSVERYRALLVAMRGTKV